MGIARYAPHATQSRHLVYLSCRYYAVVDMLSTYYDIIYDETSYFTQVLRRGRHAHDRPGRPVRAHHAAGALTLTLTLTLTLSLPQA